MKYLILLSMFIGTHAFSQTQNITITESEFTVLNDIDAPEITLFLSYTGVQFNHCGIKMKMNGYTSGEMIAEHFIVAEDVDHINEIRPTSLVAKLKDTHALTFGHFFTLKTISGKNISEEILSMSNSHPKDAIVENLACNDI